MTTAAIIGAGELGGAIAHALALGESVDRVLLVDDGTVGAGKALDIRQAGAISGFDTELRGTSDPSDVLGCTVCVIADRFGSGSTEWRGDEGLAHVTRLLPFIDRAPIVCAGAQQAGLLRALTHEAGLDRRRVIGSAPEAFASAVRAIVALEARCSPREVMLTALGNPDGFVVPWSAASIGGYALDQVLTQVQLTRLDVLSNRLWPLGPYTLGLAAARVVEAIAQSSRRAFSVLTALDGEFGVRGRVGAVPAWLSPAGIVHTRVPSLSPRERVLLETALNL